MLLKNDRGEGVLFNTPFYFGGIIMEWAYGSCLVIDGGTFWVKGSVDVGSSVGSMFSNERVDDSWKHLHGWSGVYLDGREFPTNDCNKKMLMENSQFRRVILNEVQRINHRHSELLNNLTVYCEETFDGLRDIAGSSKREHVENSGGMFGAVVKHKVVERQAIVLEPCLNCVFSVYMSIANFRPQGYMSIAPIPLTDVVEGCRIFGLSVTPFVLKLFGTMDQVFIRVLTKKSGE